MSQVTVNDTTLPMTSVFASELTITLTVEIASTSMRVTLSSGLAR